MILNHMRWLVYCRTPISWSSPCRFKRSESKRINIVLKESSRRQKFNSIILCPKSRNQYIFEFSKKKPVEELYPQWNANERGPYRRVRSDQSSHIYIVLPPPEKSWIRAWSLIMHENFRRYISTYICIYISISNP